MTTQSKPTPTPILEVTELHKVYGKHEAVNGVSLVVQPGEVVAFLGPNGAGKTTTLKCIAGLLLPTSGEIKIMGRSIHDAPEESKRILGYVPDRPFVYERLTAREFLAFVADLYELDPRQSRLEGEEWLTRFGLKAFADERIEQYSHGMKQRLVMASSFFRKPKLLVIDEPMVGLDPRGARLVKSVFRGAAQNGAGVLLSTHSLAIAEEVCDRAVILFGGKVIASGTPADLRNRSGIEGNLEDVFLALTDADVSMEAVR